MFNFLFPPKKKSTSTKFVSIAQPTTRYKDNIYINFFIPDVSILPPQLQIHEIIDNQIKIDELTFLQTIGADSFCSRSGGEGINTDYVKDSFRTSLTIVLIIPDENILVGFTTIQFNHDHIYLDTICGDATFNKISNILFGVVEQLCHLLGFTKIKLSSVEEKISTYEHLGFTVDTVINPGNLTDMTNNNHFSHVFPLNKFDKPVSQIGRRHANTGRSPRTPRGNNSMLESLSILIDSYGGFDNDGSGKQKSKTNRIRTKYGKQKPKPKQKTKRGKKNK